MSKSGEILNKFQKIQDELKNVGTQILDDYPQSPVLVNLVGELNIAKEALEALRDNLATAVETAERETTLKTDFLKQMQASEVYRKLDEEDRDKIAEYLIKNGTELADTETLMGYIKQALNQRQETELVSMFPKQLLIEKGKAAGGEQDGFDAYSAGLTAFKQELAQNRDQALNELANLWVQKGLERVAKEFYAEALKGDSGGKTSP